MAARKPKDFQFTRGDATFVLPPFDPEKRVWATADETRPAFDARAMLLLSTHAERQAYKQQFEDADTEALYSALFQTVAAHVGSESPAFDALWQLVFTDHDFTGFVKVIDEWTGQPDPLGESSGSQGS